MGYKLVLIQEFEQANQEAFLELEQKFIELEKAGKMEMGRRYVSYFGTRPNNTFIWEREFETLEALMAAKKEMDENTDHAVLYEQQVKYMVRSYTEIYKSID